MTQPDTTLYKKLIKSKRETERRNGGSKMSNTSRGAEGGGSDYGALNYNKEEKKEIVRDFTQSILFQSGSTGGNKNLFVDSK